MAMNFITEIFRSSKLSLSAVISTSIQFSSERVFTTLYRAKASKVSAY